VTRDQFSKLYEQGFKITCRFLVSRGVPYQSAEETAQAAWVRAWERIPQLRDSSVALTWVNSIAKNMHLQDLRCEPVKQQLDFHLPAPAFIDNSAIIVRQALGLCVEDDRMLLQQYYLDEVELDTIAKEQGLSAVGVRVRLLRARRRLRKVLDS
jgi:RNA polymerase sigma factor (sigma-70 family)